MRSLSDKSTSKYIYQTLFLDGENSDIKIYALEQEWKLHKIYLSQSPYFACMFNGSWRESLLSEIDLQIPDPAIDTAALKTAFGSLYRDYVFIKPVEVVGVLAAAFLLQLDGLKQQCLTLMSNTISGDTVCSYHEACCRYSVENLKAECYNWLLTNILTSTDLDLFKQISVDMMKNLVGDPRLFVMQVEMDVYTVLKRWIFLKENPTWCGDYKSMLSVIDDFFKRADEPDCYLESSEGQTYLPAFSPIRWQHIVIDLDSLLILEQDRIINLEWIKPLYHGMWRKMKLEQSKDKGPEEIPDENHFNQTSLRCGRLLKCEGEYCWRWVGYNYGVDILLTYVNNLIFIKRNTLTQPNPHSASLEKVRNFAYRLTVASVDKDGKVTETKTTEIQKLSLHKDEEMLALTVTKAFTFPLYLSMNILLTGQVSSQPDHIDICTAAQSRKLQNSSSQTCKVITCNAESQTENIADNANKSLIQDVSLSSSTIKLCNKGKVVSDPRHPKKKLSLINHKTRSDDSNPASSAATVELLSSTTSQANESENTDTDSAPSVSVNNEKRALRYPEEEFVL
ncbi:germ cell-less protein-like 1 [Saccostrea cucullata]|uniref:germ cell-less protein-like 1 n=1 Tax=Saccostrea cuccullata TaxID=36930 RepID=UPI002ED05F90